jgi:hypothetical protein
VEVERQKYYEHVAKPSKINDVDQLNRLWNHKTITERIKPCKEPDVLLEGRKETRLLIEVSKALKEVH